MDQSLLSTDQSLSAAMAHYFAGNLAEAEFFCTQVVAADPNHADALYLLGMISGQLGRKDEAIKHLERSVALKPNQFEALYNLASCYEEKGKDTLALDYYKKSAAVDNNFVPAVMKIALLSHKLNLLDEARDAYELALSLKPDEAVACHNLGILYVLSGDHDKASAMFEQTLALDPHSITARHNLSGVERLRGNLSAAIAHAKQAISQDPTFPDAHKNLGDCYFAQRNYKDSVEAYNKAIALRPDFMEAHVAVAMAHALLNNCTKATKHYDSAAKLASHSITPRWGACIATLPISFALVDEIEAARNRYSANLQELSSSIKLRNDAEIDEAVQILGSVHPFYLTCQGKNDRELQDRYGRMAQRVMSKKYPQWSTPLSPRKIPKGDRIKIGVVSGFFREQSVWKILIKGLAEGLDRSKFQTFAYYTGGIKDSITARARELFDSFYEAEGLEPTCDRIRIDEPDILIYPDIGMDPMSTRMAALRLAPVQCTSWGHPTTSGFPTMDYYLTSDLMEPDDAQDHYTEKLIRLPNLGISYIPLEQTEDSSKLESYGIRKEAVQYLCMQAVHKYLPQYDFIYPQIAARVPNSQIIFAPHPEGTEGVLKQRLEAVFAAAGMNWREHVCLLPFIPNQEYSALCAQDNAIFLDSIEFSGCTTTLEALEKNCVPLTLPGSTMRSRLTSAMLKMMDLPELMASDLDEYVDIAVRLGNDASLLKDLKQRIAARKHVLFRDQKPTEALMEFFQGLYERQ